MLALALALIDLLLLALLLAALLLHLGLELAAAAVLVVNEDLAGLDAPLGGELGRLELGGVDGPLVLADEQHAGVGNGLVEAGAVLLVHELRLRLLEPVKGVGRLRVPRLVRVDEQRLFAVRVLDVRIGHTWVQVQYGVGVKPERLEDTVDLCILEVNIMLVILS